MSASDFLPPRGRVAGLPFTFVVERELSAQEVADLALGGSDAPAPTVGPPPIQRIRAPHHQAARLVAQGLSNVEIGLAVGRTSQRISDLRGDPAFCELVAYYEAQRIDEEDEDRRRVAGKLKSAMETSLDEINERLDDDAKRAAIPLGELRQIVALGADRTVAPPKSAQPGATAPANITLNFNSPAKPAQALTSPTIDNTQATKYEGK